jgi:hypothetical protein
MFTPGRTLRVLNVCEILDGVYDSNDKDQKGTCSICKTRQVINYYPQRILAWVRPNMAQYICFYCNVCKSICRDGYEKLRNEEKYSYIRLRIFGFKEAIYMETVERYNKHNNTNKNGRDLTVNEVLDYSTWYFHNLAMHPDFPQNSRMKNVERGII